MALVVDPAAGGWQLQGHQIRRRGALLIQDQNVALFREFPARADNSLHLRNTGRLAQAQGLAYFLNHLALFLQFDAQDCYSDEI